MIDQPEADKVSLFTSPEAERNYLVDIMMRQLSGKPTGVAISALLNTVYTIATSATEQARATMVNEVVICANAILALDIPKPEPEQTQTQLAIVK